MKKLVNNKDVKINVKEPIIMRLLEDKIELPLNEIQGCFVNEDRTSIIIDNPSKDMFLYMRTLCGLIRNPMSGYCVYPDLLNIDKDIAYEYFIFKTTDIDSNNIFISSDDYYNTHIKCVIKNIEQSKIELEII